MDMNKVRRAIFGVTIGVILLIVIVLIAQPKQSAMYPSCNHQIERPNNASTGWPTVASSDYVALVRGANDYIYFEKQKTYLPMKLEGVELQQMGDNKSLVLSFDCTRITFQMKHSESEIILHQINIETLLNGGYQPLCQIHLQYEWSDNYRFECRDSEGFHCLRPSGEHARVFFNRLEFEINGNTKEHERGVFNYEPAIMCDSV